MKTFRKAIAIMLTLVFMLSLVSVSGMAEAKETHKVEMINEFFGDGSNVRDYSLLLRSNATNGGYRAFFQFDFSGYEYLLNDDNANLSLSLQGRNDSSAKTSSFRIFVLPDKCDGYATVYKPSGLNFNSLSTYLTTNIDIDNDTPFVIRTDNTNTNSVLVLPANKQLVLDVLDVDDSLVTFQFVGGPNSTQTNKNGFTHASENTFLQINSAGDADPQTYVNALADKVVWELVSNEDINNVTSALTLPEKFYGSTITWSSSNEEAVNSSDGSVVVNPDANTYVTLTATLSYTTYEGVTVTAEKAFNIKLPRNPYDYSTGNGYYHDGDNAFMTRGSASGGNHIGSVSVVTGIAGKEDPFYKLQDANGKTRYDFEGPDTEGNTYRDVIEFSICIPSDAYGYANIIRVYTGKDATDSTSSVSELNYKNDGIYSNRSGSRLVKWDGSKWHHVAVQVPGIVSSDADGIVYDRTFKIYVDGICEYNLSVEEEDFPAPHGIQYVQTNGLCPAEDYTEDKVWDTVACYLDNLRWTHDAYVPEYNTLSSVASASYEIDDNNLITITNSGVTVADLEADLTIDEDAVIRVYNAAGVLVEDKSQGVADGYTVVVADTNGTTAERSYAYYNIRVIEDGTMEFDASVIESEDGNVNGSVKLYNNTDAAKTYDVYLVVYSEKEAVTVLEPVTLSVDGGSVGTVDTASVAFANGNIAKVLVWEQGTTTPAIKSVQYK